MLRTRVTRVTGGRATVLAFGVVVVATVGCGSSAGTDVLGTSVTVTSQDAATTTTGGQSTTTVDVQISATSVVREQGEGGEGGGAGASRPAAAGGDAAPVRPTDGEGRPDDGSVASEAASGPTSDAVARVGAAIEAGDLCDTYRALGRVDVSGSAPERMRREMLVVVELLERTRPLVPVELTASWDELVEGSRSVVAVLERDGASVADVAAVYRDDGFRAAMEATDEWMDEHCGA